MELQTIVVVILCCILYYLLNDVLDCIYINTIRRVQRDEQTVSRFQLRYTGYLNVDSERCGVTTSADRRFGTCATPFAWEFSKVTRWLCVTSWRTAVLYDHEMPSSKDSNCDSVQQVR